MLVILELNFIVALDFFDISWLLNLNLFNNGLGSPFKLKIIAFYPFTFPKKIFTLGVQPHMCAL